MATNKNQPSRNSANASAGSLVSRFQLDARGNSYRVPNSQQSQPARIKVDPNHCFGSRTPSSSSK